MWPLLLPCLAWRLIKQSVEQTAPKVTSCGMTFRWQITTYVLCTAVLLHHNRRHNALLDSTLQLNTIAGFPFISIETMSEFLSYCFTWRHSELLKIYRVFLKQVATFKYMFYGRRKERRNIIATCVLRLFVFAVWIWKWQYQSDHPETFFTGFWKVNCFPMY